MRSNDLVEPKGPRRWTGANNLPGALARKPGWKHPYLQAAKLIAWAYSRDAAGSDERLIANREWSVVGVHQEGMLAAVRQILPDIDVVWEAERARCAKSLAAALHNRVWYMYRRRIGKTLEPCLSRENPLVSKRLKPYSLRAIETWVARKPLSQSKVEELFA